MKISNRELITYLEDKNDWCESSELSDVFAVSTKTITNYIKRINDFCKGAIESGRKGYRRNFDVELDKSSLFFNDDFSGRVNYILRKIISNKNTSAYELADDLYISDSHLELLLKHIKKIISKYDLTLYRKRNTIEIKGREIDKRKLISSLIQKENIDFIETNASLFYDRLNDVKILSDKLTAIFAKNNVFINDYNYNTILVYIVIMISRIQNSQIITSNNIIHDSVKNNKLSKAIKEEIEKLYSIQISDDECYYLTLTINNYTNFANAKEITLENIHLYVFKSIIKKTISAIITLENNYHLPQFDNAFKIKMILHIAMLFDRIKNSEITTNPLTNNIKNSYPFIYEMATFFIKTIFDKELYEVSDIEISFVAMHIGAFIEYNNIYEKLNCCFVYLNYHNYYESIVNDIISKFGDKINLTSTVNIRLKNTISNDNDFVITNYPLLKIKNLPVVVVDDFLTDENRMKISDTINSLLHKKKMGYFKTCIDKFLTPALFLKNPLEDTPLGIIKKMIQDAISYNYCTEEFLEEVYERETLSSTSFDSCIAIPHSLYQKCSKSFLSVAIYDEPIIWADKKINVVIILGVNNNDNYEFSNILNEIIPCLSQKSNVLKLQNSNSYNDFITKLIEIINEK